MLLFRTFKQQQRYLMRVTLILVTPAVVFIIARAPSPKSAHRAVIEL